MYVPNSPQAILKAERRGWNVKIGTFFRRLMGKGHVKRAGRVFAAIAAVLMISIGVPGGTLKSQVGQQNAVDRIRVFASLLEGGGMSVNGWSVYARDRIAIADGTTMDRYINLTMKQLPGFSWRRLKTGHGDAWEAKKETVHPDAQVKVLFTEYPGRSEDGSNMAVLYQVDASSFDPNTWEKIRQKMEQEMAAVFSGGEQIFSCVRASGDDTMESGLLKKGEQLLQRLSAVPVEWMNEKTFVSISAYNAAWSDGLNSGSQKMNVQAALRNNGNTTSVTLGTPIITTEY